MKFLGLSPDRRGSPSSMFVLLTLFAMGPLTSATLTAQDHTTSPRSPSMEDLRSGSNSPPPSARLRCYWWWLNGHTDKATITHDLEEMRAKGFGGALLVDANGANQEGNADVPAGPTFGSPEWMILYTHALREADRLGLESLLFPERSRRTLLNGYPSRCDRRLNRSVLRRGGFRLGFRLCASTHWTDRHLFRSQRVQSRSPPHDHLSRSCKVGGTLGCCHRRDQHSLRSQTVGEWIYVGPVRASFVWICIHRV